MTFYDYVCNHAPRTGITSNMVQLIAMIKNDNGFPRHFSYRKCGRPDIEEYLAEHTMYFSIYCGAFDDLWAGYVEAYKEKMIEHTTIDTIMVKNNEDAALEASITVDGENVVFKTKILDWMTDLKTHERITLEIDLAKDEALEYYEKLEVLFKKKNWL